MKKLILILPYFAVLSGIAQIDTSLIKNIVTIEDQPFTHVPIQSVSPVNVIQSQDTNYRRIHFIHGLGGDASSWQRASDACWDQSLNLLGFPARKVEISRPEYIYSTNTTLNSAAYDVRQQIRNQAFADILQHNMNPNRAIMIGHSQGGMIIRALVNLDLEPNANIPYFGKGYGGFVTIASPLQGAQIINNRYMIEQMANDACVSLMKGPGASNTALNVILKLFGKELTSSSVCNMISNDILPIFFSQYYDNITNDYKVGAPAIATFNADVQYPSYMTMPKIAIYGEEPRNNILWRTANWLINNPNDFEPFKANDDWNFYLSVIKPTYNYYLVNFIDYANRINILQMIQNHISPLLIPTTSIVHNILIVNYLQKLNAWSAGVEWFNNANADWETIIGARSYSFYTDYTYYCHSCVGLSSWVLTPNLQTCVNKNCRIIIPMPSLNIQWTYKPNDGIVLAESASNLPGATAVPPRILINNLNTYAGSSHMQIRNDEYLKRSFFKLFEGEYGGFFKTKEKSQN
ncbi:MAG TPA: alpha/beta hydrolase [Bacteroidales bacterium]|jgi:pimeloyl-ACP methyl ester carboxylesterase|nr:alpha/beta hydrolase [Bacteroidales bacterium]HPS70912.1 alpha/beta hydrolase [Bacteroidales bacterium]